ncbi:MAG: Ig family protein [Verrucomicrobia bacterium]|nr:Ig family protein [Verrucomicrobiota bacterium]
MVALSQASLSAQTNTPSAADGFDANVDGPIYAIATQSDGKIVIAGMFANVGGIAHGNIARLNIDGTVDGTFNAATNDKVTSIVIQADGKIVIGGYFSTVQPTTGSLVTRNRIARLNADGTVDSFDPNLGGALAPGVEALLVQADGKVVAGGTFTLAGTVTRNRMARFNSNGSLDTGFDPNPDRTVLALALQSNGQIVVGGGFTKLQPAGAATATLRANMARVNADGSLDAGYDPNLNNGVTKLVVEQDGRVIAGGYFTTAAPNGAGGTTATNHVARFNVDGSVDATYLPVVNGNVLAMSLQSNGSLLLGGTFTAIQSVRRSYVGRVNADGSLDTTFDPSPNFSVFALAEQSDGSILLGGNFTQIQANGAVAPTTRNHIARVNKNGTLDADFGPDTNGRVLSLLMQSDGKALVGGSFTSIGGVTRNYFARLNADGSLDTAFDPNFNGEVSAIAVQSDGRILVGGSFTTVKGIPKLHLVRLNTDGSLDASFEPNPDSAVFAIVVQTDNKILVGGSFLTFRPNGSALSTTRTYLARINSNGSLDTFDSGCTGPVYAIKFQSDGKFLVGGLFTAFNAGFRNNIARFKADATLDPDYNPVADGRVNAIALQSDGKAVIGGVFNVLQPSNGPILTINVTNSDGTISQVKTNALARRAIARLNVDGTVDPGFDPAFNNIVRSLVVQSDGKIIAGGVFTGIASHGSTTFADRTYIARITTDGLLDDSYNLLIAPRVGNQVIAMALQSDGKLLIGGAFSTLGTGTSSQVTRNSLARVETTGAVDTSYSPSTGQGAGAVINSLTVQADGRILVGGAFTSFGGSSSSNLARFNGDSVPDATFNPNVNGAVNSIVTRVLGGANGTQLANFAFLNSNGTLRNSFRPASNQQISGEVHAVLVQPDGKVLIAGAITDLSGATGGNIIRYNADGTIDTSFNPKPDLAVLSMALQPDGKIVIGGNFVNVNGVARQYIARLNPDGGLDANFDPKASAAINAISLQADGKILLGGSFTSLQPNASTIVYGANYLARLNADGTIDSTFLPSPNGVVYALATQSDGAVIVGGAFSTVLEKTGSSTSVPRNFVARFSSSGTTDTTFDPSPGGVVLALAIQADGKVVLGGTFTFLQANKSPTIITRNYIARVNPDGTLDAGFDPNFNGGVSAILLQPDGKLVIGGVFTSIQPAGVGSATSRNRIARLNTDGTVDGSFDPAFNGSVTSLALLPDGGVIAGGAFSTVEPSGTILVGGSFTNIGGAPISNLALLNVGGSAFSSFAPNPNGTVYALAARPDNRVLVAGTFTTIAGASRPGLAQLTADGAIDSTFATGATVTGGPAVLLLQPDGKVLVGGTNVGFNGTSFGTLERLAADGTLDASFHPSGLGTINAIAAQPDGKILVGGAAPSRLVRLAADGSIDGTFNPAPNGTVNSIAVQSDGRIVVGGSFTSIGGLTVSNLARLNANGTADATYNPNVNGAVTAIALQSTGKVLFGGGFTMVGNQSRFSLARVASTSPAGESLDISANFSTVTWTRTGSGPAVVSATFERSNDGRTWTTLGQGTRVGTSDTWQFASSSLSTGSAFFVRARGVAVTSQYSSSGVVEAIRQFVATAQPQILSASTATGTSGSAFFFGVATNVSGATFSASGLPSGLSIDPSTGIISGTTSQTGVFPVTLTVTNGSGSATSVLTLSINPPGSGAAVVRFVNLSARAQVSSSDPLIAGLVISGTTSRTVLLRAIGPTLASYGVANGIPHPHMKLFNTLTGVLLNENEVWGGGSALTSVFAQAGAFPLPANSADSAMVVTLSPGSYSVVVSDSSGATGISLAEVYDTGTDASASAPRLVNISARATANTGENVLIGGFVVTGSAPKRMLIRGVGPALANYGVTAFMTNPILSLYDGTNGLIAQNDDWGTPVTITSGQPGATGASITTATTQAGAFSFAAGSGDSAIIVTLPPGSYSAQVKSSSGAAGTSLVEIYELP